MKKLMTMAAIFALSTSAFAGFQGNSSNNNGNGGFNGTGSGQGVSTVAQAKKANDNSWAVLTGYIVSRSGDERYTFKDATGQIQVEIDDKIWGSVQANPKTKVTIEGEVDKEYGRTEIDVKRIYR